MVMYGMETTLGVTLDMMIAHGQAVMRGSSRACCMVDLPVGSYQESPDQAFRSCARVMAETGCAGVKLEGGAEMAGAIRYLVERGVAVMGHVGLKPQSVNTLGGFRAQGRTEEEAAQVMRDARAVAESGAFSLVIEGTVEPVARAVTAALAIPTIGIGAGPHCDGQVLVIHDMLGLSASAPSFAKEYASLGAAIRDAAAAYAADVRSGAFPAAARRQEAHG
jgi:3-methyl-2-oxobutanoate hydroxymethyltransferase